jgi:hypothetical protein
MRKSRIVAALATVLFAAAVTTYTVSVGVDEARVAGDSQFWTKRLLVCQQPDVTDTVEYMDRSYDCLYEAMRDAIWNNSYEEFNDALRPLTASDVMLEYVCHIPGHDLGKEIVEYYRDDYRSAVMDLASNLCGSGIVHGIYDVFGESERSIEDWQMMGNVCVASNQYDFNACGDALGHAAFESTGRNLVKAMQICDNITSAWVQYTCANGAYMQQNFPQSTKLKKIATPPVKNDPELWDFFIQFCDEQKFANPGTMEGCYGGAGWVMGNTIYGINAGFMEEQRENGIDVNENQAVPEQEQLILTRAKQAVAVCMSGTDPNGSRLNCVGDMLSRMPIFFYRSGTAALERYCSTVTQGQPATYRDKCIGSAHQHVTPQDMAELVRANPGALEYVLRSNPELAAGIAEYLGMGLVTSTGRGTGRESDMTTDAGVQQ